MLYKDSIKGKNANRKSALRYYYQNKERIDAAYNVKRATNTEAYRSRARIYHKKRIEKLAGKPRPENCEICNVLCVPHWDHDHATGEFRGWVCKKCNLALGFANDDIEILKRMIAYLQRSNENIAIFL